MTGEVDGTVHHLQGDVEPGPVLLLEVVLGHRQEALKAASCSCHVVPNKHRQVRTFTKLNNVKLDFNSLVYWVHLVKFLSLYRNKKKLITCILFTATCRIVIAMIPFYRLETQEV